MKRNSLLHSLRESAALLKRGCAQGTTCEPKPTPSVVGFCTGVDAQSMRAFEPIAPCAKKAMAPSQRTTEREAAERLDATSEREAAEH